MSALARQFFWVGPSRRRHHGDPGPADPPRRAGQLGPVRIARAAEGIRRGKTLAGTEDAGHNCGDGYRQMIHATPSLVSILAMCIAVLGGANVWFAQGACQHTRLTASDSGPFESFGYSVVVSGDTAVVGAQWDNDNGPQSGSAYVFRQQRTSWAETLKLVPSDGGGGNRFGNAVAVDGDIAMIGAFAHLHDPDSGSGSVYVFQHNGSSWIQRQELLASDGALGDHFGESVSITGDVAVIGANRVDDNGANSGAAYIFRFDSKSQIWVEEQKLLASDGAAGDFFGTAVALAGDIVIIGANGDDDKGAVSGSAYVFRYDSLRRTWVEEQKLLASDGAKFDEFGVSVSISGDTVLIGARLNGNGSAYIFGYDPGAPAGSQWVQEQKLVGSEPGGTDQFGWAVAIDGDTAVIGAWSWSSFPGGPSIGQAYVFRYNGSRWVEQQQLSPEPNPWTNFFGASVAISGHTAVIGADGEDTGAGAAYVYDLSACLCPADLDGDGNVGILDLLALLAVWGTNPGGPPDFDGDGNVGILDLLTLLANWGACP